MIREMEYGNLYYGDRNQANLLFGNLCQKYREFLIENPSSSLISFLKSYKREVNKFNPAIKYFLVTKCMGIVHATAYFKQKKNINVNNMILNNEFDLEEFGTYTSTIANSYKNEIIDTTLPVSEDCTVDMAKQLKQIMLSKRNCDVATALKQIRINPGENYEELNKTVSTMAKINFGAIVCESRGENVRQRIARNGIVLDLTEYYYEYYHKIFNGLNFKEIEK